MMWVSKLKRFRAIIIQPLPKTSRPRQLTPRQDPPHTQPNVPTTHLFPALSLSSVQKRARGDQRRCPRLSHARRLFLWQARRPPLTQAQSMLQCQPLESAMLVPPLQSALQCPLLDSALQCPLLDSALQSLLLDSALKCPRLQSALKCPHLQSALKCPLLQSARLIQPLLPPRNFWDGGSMAPAVEARAGTGAAASDGLPSSLSRHGLPSPQICHGLPSSLIRPGGVPRIPALYQHPGCPPPLPGGIVMARDTPSGRGR